MKKENVKNVFLTYSSQKDMNVISGFSLRAFRISPFAASQVVILQTFV